MMFQMRFSMMSLFLQRSLTFFVGRHCLQRLHMYGCPTAGFVDGYNA